MSTTAPPRWLHDEVTAGRIDTVALSFADRLGGWRGKRVPAKELLERGPLTLGFCDGMIVCDVRCGVIEETPFSNFSTGYPDLHVTFDPIDARPVGWRPGEAYVFGVPSDHHGAPLAVAPTAVLDSVVRRVSASGPVEVSGAALSGAFAPRRGATSTFTAGATSELARRLFGALEDSWIACRYLRDGYDEGSFTLGIEGDGPLRVAESLVVAKGAAKELARGSGYEAVFMTRRPGGGAPGLLEVELALGTDLPLARRLVSRRLGQARPLLFPSVNAMRQAPPDPVLCADGGQIRCRLFASAEADPATVLAVGLAALAAPDQGDSAIAAPVVSLAEIGRLADQDWLLDWLGKPFVDNSVALLRYEWQLFEEAVTDWEIERYWGVA